MIYLAYIVALVLVLICVLAVLVILMQRPSANAGMGAALGGGAAESVFGGDSANVLNKVTYTLVSIFFVLCFGLYLGFMVIGTADTGDAKGLDAVTQGETAPVTPPAAPQPVIEGAAPEATPSAPAAPETAPSSETPAAPAPAAQ